MSCRRTRFWLWAILLLALILRLSAAVAVQHVVSRTPGRLCLIAGDAEGYWELGRQIAHGKNFEIYEPPRRVLRMPGFPAVLALSMVLFGEDVGRARLVLALIGTLACGCVFLLANDLFGPKIGLIATALAAVSPTFIVFSVMILSETTFALGLLLSVIALERLVVSLSSVDWSANVDRALRDRNSSSHGVTRLHWRQFAAALIAGLAAAIACYIRPSWLLFPPAAAAWIYLFPPGNFEQNTEGGLKKTPRIRLAAAMIGLIMLLGLALGLTPWTVRNYFVTGGKIVPTTLWMGPSLYDGLNPEANGDSHMEFLPNSVYEEMSEYDVDRLYRRKAWTWAAQNPGKTLELAWIKLGRYWNLVPNTPQFDHWYVRLGLLGFVVPVLGLAVWGIVVGSRYCLPQSVTWTWVLIVALGPILYFSGLHTLFVSSLRYRLPAEYPLLALSAVGIWDLWQRCRTVNERGPT